MKTVILIAASLVVSTLAQAAPVNLNVLSGVYRGNKACPQEQVKVTVEGNSIKVYYDATYFVEFKNINGSVEKEFYDQTRSRLVQKNGVLRIVNEHRTCTHFVIDCGTWHVRQEIEFSRLGFTQPGWG